MPKVTQVYLMLWSTYWSFFLLLMSFNNIDLTNFPKHSGASDISLILLRTNRQVCSKVCSHIWLPVIFTVSYRSPLILREKKESSLFYALLWSWRNKEIITKQNQTKKIQKIQILTFIRNYSQSEWKFLSTFLSKFN